MGSNAEVKWVRYKAYSGLKMTGTTKVSKPTTRLHMERAYWLTAMLEAPLYGSVQSYDGAAMSGGPLHNIAVYPRSMTQGSLFPLLRRLEAAFVPQIIPLWSAFKAVQWYVARDGKLRNINNGALISGRAIRNEFSPNHGKVPKHGAARKQATRWIRLFHTLLSHPDSYGVQKEYAIDYLIKTRSSDEKKFYKRQDLQLLRAAESREEKSTSMTLHLALDLAMCVYHSHSVNGPAPAKSVLLKTLDQHNPSSHPVLFAQRLIYNLGKKRYGRWRDTTDGKNRYDRTRYWARAGGLWPEEFFEAQSKGGLMPANLPSRFASKE